MGGNPSEFHLPSYRKTGTTTQRQLIISSFGLNLSQANDQALLKLLVYLLNAKKDRDFSAHPVPVNFLRECKKDTTEFNTTREFLYWAVERIQQYVPEVSIRPGVGGKHVTLVENFQMPEAMHTAYYNQFKEPYSPKTSICLVTGNKAGSNNATKIREKALQRCDSTTQDSRSNRQYPPFAYRVLDYLNAQDSKVFSQTVNANFNQALQWIESRHSDDALEQATKTGRYLQDLATVSEQAQPFYSIGGDTPRLAIHGGLGSIKREIRQRLCTGLTEVDLRNCHLAIVATLWQLPTLADLLTQQSIWSYLQEQFKLQSIAEAKAIFKRPLYAACYGMRKQDLHHSFAVEEENAFRPEHQSYEQQFRRLPFIKELFKSRDARLRRIKDEGIIDAWGIHHSPTNNPKSLLSYEVVSYEQRFIHEIFKLAMTEEAASRSGFSILLYQNDGVCIRFHSTSTQSQEKWVRELRRVVQQEAIKLGFNMALDCERLSFDTNNSTAA